MKGDPSWNTDQEREAQSDAEREHAGLPKLQRSIDQAFDGVTVNPSFRLPDAKPPQEPVTIAGIPVQQETK